MLCALRKILTQYCGKYADKMCAPYCWICSNKRLGKQNDISTMGETDTGRAKQHTGERTSVNSRGGTEQFSNPLEDDNSGRRAVLGDNVTGRDRNETLSGIQTERSSGNPDVVQIQSSMGDIRDEFGGGRTVHDGRAHRDLRNGLDKVDGGKPQEQSGEYAPETQVSDSGAVGGQGGLGVPESVGRTVRTGEPAPVQLRGNSGVGTHESVSHRQRSDARAGADSGNRGLEKLNNFLMGETPIDDTIGVFDYDEEADKSELVSLTFQIGNKQQEFSALITSGDYEKSAVIAEELTTLAQQAQKVKLRVQASEIKTADVEVLRNIEPKRKSVQNLLEKEVAETAKFEKLLDKELGKLSPYELRKHDLRAEESTIVPVITVEKRDVSNVIADKKSGAIERGEFVNRDTSFVIGLGKKNIDEIITKAIQDGGRKKPVEARLSALYQMREIVENAVFLDSQVSEPKKINSNTLFMHKMYVVFNHNEEHYLANLAVEEMYRDNDDVSNTHNRIYSFRDIKITPLRKPGGKAHFTPSEDGSISQGVTATFGDTISISQLRAIVKSFDKNFYENLSAPGRKHREAEITNQETYTEAVEKFKKVTTNDKKRPRLSPRGMNPNQGTLFDFDTTPEKQKVFRDFKIGEFIEYCYNKKDTLIWEVVNVNENGNPDICPIGEMGVLRDFHYYNVNYRVLTSEEVERLKSSAEQKVITNDNFSGENKHLENISNRKTPTAAEPEQSDTLPETLPKAKVFKTLEEVEAELDRKVDLMSDNPDYDKMKEAASYLKIWRTMTASATGIAADVLVDKINDLDDAKAKEWFPKVNWNNWHKSLGIPPLFKPTRAEKLYEQFAEMFPQIVNGEHSHERYGKEDDAHEPLSVEHLGGNRYAFMTWYIQNGDLMRDPDFTFTLDKENKTLNILEYQQDGVYPVGTIYERVHDDNGRADKKLLAALERNFAQVLKSAKEADRPLTEHTLADGTKVKSQVEVIEPEQKVITNDNFSDEPMGEPRPELRQVLNDFSLKHGLGELNIEENIHSVNLIEQLKGSNSFIEIGEIDTPESGDGVPHTPETLKAALEAFETSVPDLAERHNRKKTIEAKGGISALPPVPKNADPLPEITYSENPTEKVQDNIVALRELKRIEREVGSEKGPYATKYNSKEESEKRLSKYCGWGGLPQVFDTRSDTWASQRTTLKNILTPEEYNAARESTLNAHYTPQVIIDAMYEAVKNMDLPRNAKILEPSCGTGNFIRRLPSAFNKGEVIGVEIDSITVKIAELLTPNAKILHSGFEHSNLENDSFDLAISNVPFGVYL